MKKLIILLVLFTACYAKEIVIDLDNLVLYANEKSYPICAGSKYKEGVNRGKSASPLGVFKVVLKVTFTNDNVYGSCFMRLDFQKDTGKYVGIHGTNEPESIGTYSSKMCIRWMNKHAMKLYKYIDVGDKVIIIENGTEHVNFYYIKKN